MKDGTLNTIEHAFDRGIPIKPAPVGERGCVNDGFRAATTKRINEEDDSIYRNELFKALNDNLTSAAYTKKSARLWEVEQGWQADVTSWGNPIVFHPDIYNDASRIVIELDGKHHFETSGIKYDLIRDLYLAYDGMFVVRFENQEAAGDLQRRAITQKANALHLIRLSLADRLQAGDLPGEIAPGNFPLETYRIRVARCNAHSVIDELLNEFTFGQPKSQNKRPIHPDELGKIWLQSKESDEETRPAHTKISHLRELLQKLI